MRLGLIGWAVRTGIGHQNRDLWDCGIVDSWLVPKHPVLGYDELLCPPEATRCQVSGQQSDYRRWLDTVDAVLAIESMHVKNYDIIGEAHRRGVLVCLVPNMEWLPSPSREQWVRDVDMMWAPTAWTMRELERDAEQHEGCRWRKSICGGRWGIDVERFEFRQRERVERFLFVNGHGGVAGRKGLACVLAAAAMLPSIPFLIRTQQRELPRLPRNCELLSGELPDRWGLYDDGDVLLAPSKWEGLGLQLYEAQACGLGVVTTDGNPMREAGPVRKVRADDGGKIELCPGRVVTRYEPDATHLAAHVRDLYYRDISAGSKASREYIERHHDIRQVAADLRCAIEDRHGDALGVAA